MIRNYFISALRNIARNKINTSINTLGLTLGITCSLVLFLVIRYELSFNKHFAEADRIYRVTSEYVSEEGKGVTASMQFPFANTFATAFPDVTITFIHGNISTKSFYVTENGERKRFQESSNHIALVHPSYNEIFSHNWLAGNPETALDQVNSIVMTQKMAEKFFGRVDVVGETLGHNDQADLLVTGVIEDYPKTTDFPIDLLISIETNGQYLDNVTEGWGGNYSSVNAFVKLPEGMTEEAMEARLEGFDETYSGRELTRLLQPLEELHYDETLSNYAGRTITKANLWAIGIIGALLLIAACINFVNLNTALAVRRSKEVGIRKVLGSSRKQLLLQFMGETFLVTFLALLISFGATELALINLKNHLGTDLEFNILKDGTSALFLTGAFLFAVIFSGLYPAIILASYKPIAALKNRITADSPGGFSLRKVLVTGQLMISQALIICTIIVVKQMDYFYNAPMGLDKESVIEIRVPGGDVENHKLFKSRALQVPGVESMTMASTGAISSNLWVGPYELTLNGELVQRAGTQIKFIDKDFLDTYGIELLLGDNIIERDSAYNFLVNEELIKDLGLEDYADIIGLPMSFWGREGFVTGVVSDYNTQSLHSSVSPLVMVYGAGYGASALKFKTADVKSMLSGLETIYTEIFPERDFQASFLDDTITSFYEEEQKASTLFQIAAGVAIFIGCIGMIGLISYVASRKVKEVGVRKVLGASVANIILLFSRQFFALTLIGFLLATPVAWYLMNSWLQNFENRISMGVGVFALGLLATIVLVVLSTGFRAYHSATINPAKSLRSE
jgi:ABC-type antimicrobial peptide transport system permease subunit